MLYLLVVVFAAVALRFRRNVAPAILALVTLLSACSVVGGSSTLPPMHIPQEQVREVCWEPPNPEGDDDTMDTTDTGDVGKFFMIVNDKDVIYSKNRWGFAGAIRDGGFIFKVVESAPIENLRLIPLIRTDVWCSRIPKPRDEAVRRMLDSCSGPTTVVERPAAAKNLFAQSEPPSIPSPLYCGQRPRMAMTTQEAILLRNRIEAWHEARDYAHKTSMALTQAKADTEMVNDNGGSWLKRQFTSDPGTVEQIALRLANTLNSIGEPPVFDDPGLEIIAMKGFEEGFASGQFEVEAKLFAIDAAVMLIEFAAMEVALGPLGGAKFLASAVSKGTKALSAAATRLGEIKIFLPIATNGGGAFIRVSSLLGSVSAKAHRYRLRIALEAKLKRAMAAGESTHHIVAIEHELAAESRRILAKFGIGIDDAINGVFLPAFLKSPNPKGSIVHATLANKERYYKIVEKELKKAKTPAEAIEQLRKLRKTLLDGTFYNAVL